MDPFEANYRTALEKHQKEPPLFRAVSSGNNELFKRLLEQPEQRAQLKDTDIGHDCLNCAIVQDNREIVKALVELPLSEFDWIHHPVASLKAIGHLHTAASLGRFDAFKIMADTGNVEIGGRDPYGKTPLHHASEVGSKEIVEFLVGEGVKPDETDGKGRTPLSYAAETGKNGILRVLLYVDGVGPDSKNLEGKSPFYYAIVSGNDVTADHLKFLGGGDVDRNAETKAKEDRPSYDKQRT
ncbi:hypothetical protein ACKAV7_003337 [Fusarium commune]